jgi:hypothetical protein
MKGLGSGYFGTPISWRTPLPLSRTLELGQLAGSVV